MSDQPTATTPTSWRDTYQLVQDVEGRLMHRMDEIAGTQQVVAQDHEVRLRVLERTSGADTAASAAVVSTISVGKTLLLAALSIASLIVAAVGVITR